MSADMIVRLFGRSRAWRLGRNTGIIAHADIANEMSASSKGALSDSALALHGRQNAKSDAPILRVVGARLGNVRVIAG